MTNKHTILIIEDEKNIGNYIETIVNSNQYKSIRARNGMSGISLCVSHHPDLILLDLGLPDVDGMDVLKKIREFSTVPVIVISARTQETEKVEALDLRSFWPESARPSATGYWQEASPTGNPATSGTGW